MKHDIEGLERRIKSFDLKISRFENLFGKLGPIIHNPGWTTLAEFQLVMLAMDALDQHADSIAHLQTGLLLAAQRIDDGPNSIKPPVGTGAGPTSREP